MDDRDVIELALEELDLRPVVELDKDGVPVS